MRAAEGAGCFPVEETACSKTRSGRGCSLGGGLEQVCQKCKEPVLGSGLPGIRGRKRTAFLLEVGRGKVGGGRKGTGRVGRSL